jgi:cell division cycle 2-like
MFPSTSFSGGVTLSESGFDLLSRLLIFNPMQRISARDALDHKWFKESPSPTEIFNMPKFDFPEKE